MNPVQRQPNCQMVKMECVCVCVCGGGKIFQVMEKIQNFRVEFDTNTKTNNL